MLSIGNKTFMNLQEAVGWLLENNALPFQSTANYVGNTEIAMSTLINPSPAKVRVGSIIFFADSKVSTVVGVTSNSFIVSDQYNDLVDDVVYVSNVAINASGHLIVTLSNGTDIDAGLIKQVSNFNINASQHLIANYNDGTTTDLGAIFSGNVNISGTLNATAITGDSIIENMSGYRFDPKVETGLTYEYIYASVCKNGNKLSFAVVANVTKTDNSAILGEIGHFTVPNDVMARLYPTLIGGSDRLEVKSLDAIDAYNHGERIYGYVNKGETKIAFGLSGLNALTLNTKYFVRYEVTFLLSDNLVS